MARLKMKKTAFIAASLTATILLFQNCSGGGGPFGKFSPSSQSRLTSGNGSTYDGKLYAGGGTCTGGEARSLIQVKDDGSGTLLREDCQDITPLPVPAGEVGLLPHNLANLIFHNRVFNRVQPQPQVPTQLLCRGQESRSYIEGDYTFAADAVITKLPSGGLEGHVKTGVYDKAGNLVLARELPKVAVTQINPPVGGGTVVQLVGSDAQQKDSFLLNYNQSGPSPWPGSLNYLSASLVDGNNIVTTPTPQPPPALRSIEDIDTILTAVTCYTE